jgi:hypothetical protein
MDMEEFSPPVPEAFTAIGPLKRLGLNLGDSGALLVYGGECSTMAAENWYYR